MFGTSLTDIQTAIYKRLVPSNLDSGLALLGVTGVFDSSAVPQNQAFRYITLGDNMTENSKSAFSHYGYDVTVALNIWAQDRSHRKLYDILARCNQLLLDKDNPLILPNLGQAGIWYLNAQPMPTEPDSVTIRLIPRYRIFSMEAR